MEAIAQYGDDDEVDEGTAVLSRDLQVPGQYMSAPVAFTAAIVPVASSGNNPFSLQRKPVDTGINLPVGAMYAPALGPSHPMRRPDHGSVGLKKIEATSVADWSFREQHNSFQGTGRALDYSTGQVVMDKFARPLTGPSTGAAKSKPNGSAATKRKRIDEADIGDDSAGPWAAEKDLPVAKLPAKESAEEEKGEGGEGEGDSEEKKSAANMHILEPEEEDEKWEKVNERKQSYVLPPRPARGTQAEEAKSTFHGSALYDYQGRPWCAVPSGVKADGGDHACYIPKKCIKKYTGHTKGVQAIEFFPGTGHLLLSGSMDGKCKIWDVLEDRNVRRTYQGHTEGVRSIHMSNDGSEFLSSAFDRYMRLWDVETGQAKGTFCNRKMGYQVKFYPNDNHIFLMAASDNKVYQWDTRTGNVCQEYNYHLQPCNTITFIDEGRKFVSTSDDKKVLVWEYDIPVPIKYIAEPDMHSVPSVTVHPSGQFFVGQSMDNTIVTYSCGEKVRQLKKRTFKGHNNSGYACQIGFSPNGQFMLSGDGHGKLFVWDWKSGKIYKKFQAHEGGPTIGAQWSPLHPNYVATCGWDGLIKLWE